MKTFTVYQPNLTDEQIDEINRLGWGGSEIGDAYARATILRAGHEDARVLAAAELGLYHLAYKVEAEDVADTFGATNGYPENGARVVERYGRPKSGSVGDVVFEDTGRAWVCISIGWHELGAKAAIAVAESAKANALTA